MKWYGDKNSYNGFQSFHIHWIWRLKRFHFSKKILKFSETLMKYIPRKDNFLLWDSLLSMKLKCFMMRMSLIGTKWRRWTSTLVWEYSWKLSNMLVYPRQENLNIELLTIVRVVRGQLPSCVYLHLHIKTTIQKGVMIQK